MHAKMCAICTLCTGNVHDLHVTFGMRTAMVETRDERNVSERREDEGVKLVGLPCLVALTFC